MTIFILFLLFPAVVSYDFPEEARKYIDHNVNPCDNFYRHACASGSHEWLPRHILEERMENLPEISSKAQKSFEVYNDILEDKSGDFLEMISRYFKTICESGADTSDFLLLVQESLSRKEECAGTMCLTHLSKDPNCDRVAKYVQKELSSYLNIEVIIDNFREQVKHFVKKCNEISMYAATLDKRRISKLDNLFMEMKDIALELIQRTPWANNHNVTNMISAVVGQLKLKNLMFESETLFLTFLDKAEENYLSCKKRLSEATVPLPLKFCNFYAATNMKLNNTFAKKLSDFNELSYIYEAGTVYPNIFFGHVWYHIFQNSGSRAARLGSPGFTLAHELSHAIIRSVEGDIISYFSQEAMNCIQAQYASTCKEFDEGGCRTGRFFFEENGADVLSMNIISVIFERHFTIRQKRARKELSSEEFKQFFYSVASVLCSGEKGVPKQDDPHSPANIRINALVNHPLFQEAFQCPEDSRMMFSKTKQCSVYGENAPQHRRRLFPDNKL